MKQMLATGLLLCTASTALSAQAPAPNPLHRQYREGQTLSYRMNVLNESWRYSIQSDSIIKKDANGAFFEEIRWSGMQSNGQPAVLSAAMQQMRQRFSLDPNFILVPPNMRQLEPQLVGPVTDFGTFYADLWIVLKTGQLTKPGDHFHFSVPITPSWADGSRILLGEDSFDFDMTWKSTNQADQTAILLIRHVPPAKPTVHLSADWMQKSVADTPNNWVQVRKLENGKFEAAVGQETFDVELKVDLKDGKILHGSMENPVRTIERTCTDQALTQCDTAKPHDILRRIDITLVP